MVKKWIFRSFLSYDALMGPDAKRLIAVTGLISISLAGLILVQALLLEQTYQQKLSLFRRNAETALLGIVEKLETRETLERLVDVKVRPSPDGSPARTGLGLGGKTEARTGDVSIPISADPVLMARIDKILDQTLGRGKKTMADRIPMTEMDGIVRAMLRNQKIEINSAYGILRTDTGEFLHAVPSGSEDMLRASGIRARLYPHDLTPEPYELVLDFPGQKKAILSGMILPAAAALVFLGITVGCFAVTLSALAGQRKFASRLTDFINAMAHAFKTPLSTLNLAGAALSHENVLRDEQQLVRCGRIILEESGRMRRHAERILEMTALEKKDSVLALRPVDIHQILGRAIERFIPEAEKRGGTIRLIRGASMTRLDLDELHWQGALDNLLDNAIRYNRRTPEISVTTSGTARNLRIVVRDNGNGIPARDLRRVFEKYYRVSQGLRQETPGFGLGLSYVRWVIEAHGGSVRVRSRLDEGSEFEIDLPLPRRPSPKNALKAGEPEP